MFVSILHLKCVILLSQNRPKYVWRPGFVRTREGRWKFAIAKPYTRHNGVFIANIRHTSFGLVARPYLYRLPTEGLTLAFYTPVESKMSTSFRADTQYNGTADVVNSSLKADYPAKSVSLDWVVAASRCCSAFTKWTGWTLTMAVPWWQQHKRSNFCCYDYVASA